ITKNWDVGLDMDYRTQNKARFSAGLGTSYKLNKYLKVGVSYSFLYSERPDKYKDKSEGEVGVDSWTIGYNFTPEYWFPRHRFNAEATGSIKLWKWLRVSLRERYQLTCCKARSIEQHKYREEWGMEPIFEEDGWDWVYLGDVAEMNGEPKDYWETKYYPSYTDQVLRSRLKLEFDKKRNPFSPFVSAEFHNSVTRGDHMLLQKIRTSAGITYKFRKHNEVSLAYILTLEMYDREEDVVVHQHERMHAINIGYKYSF
ncbi:MAG: DUF2490 domain-containing protein, partial [Bacteroidaceae bacterium]|nr:DUF2490 domain-containing protein [Bacteroidaceae bacterium]